MQFSDKVSNIVRAARFDSMVRNFFEMFLRARRALEFSHSQDPERSSARSQYRGAAGSCRTLMACYLLCRARAAPNPIQNISGLAQGLFGRLMAG
jgi:hypothetical protein